MEIVCPSCASEHDLTGEPMPDGRIELTCSACHLPERLDGSQ